MPVFEFRAVDDKGTAHEGVMEEESARRVAAILQEQGLQVGSVEQRDKSPGFLSLCHRLTWEDLDLFNQQLLAVTQSGLPMPPALKAIAGDIRSRRLRRVFHGVRERLEQGETLESALGAFPESFSPVYLSIIRAGEQSGNLSGVLTQLTEHSSRTIELRGLVIERLAYPTVVVAATFFLLAYLLGFIIPLYADIFGDFGMQLPWMTRMTIGAGEFVNRWWGTGVIVAGLLAIVIWLFVSASAFPRSLGERLDWIRLRLGPLGRLYYVSSLARFTRTLGLLLASNVPLPESLCLAESIAGNASLRNATRQARAAIENGETLADAFETTEYFEHGFCWVLATSETRGDVAPTLLRLSRDYEQRLGHLHRIGLTLAGPVAVILAALVIGLVVVSLYLPVFTLADVMSGV